MPYSSVRGSSLIPTFGAPTMSTQFFHHIYSLTFHNALIASPKRYDWTVFFAICPSQSCLWRTGIISLVWPFTTKRIRVYTHCVSQCNTVEFLLGIPLELFLQRSSNKDGLRPLFWGCSISKLQPVTRPSVAAGSGELSRPSRHDYSWRKNVPYVGHISWLMNWKQYIFISLLITDNRVRGNLLIS